jgi:DNA-binding CsgD family transcriptional regulator
MERPAAPYTRLMIVGREPERGAIERLVAGARIGAGGSLVLSGEAGIGKTALLEHATSRLAGMRVLRATGSETDREVPFGGLLQLLRPVLRRIDGIPGPQADSLAVALALRAGAAGDRFAVGAATLSLLSRVAEDEPLALVVDDAHLLDGPSADAVVFAARRLLADPVVLLAAVRSGEPSAFTAADLPRLDVGGVPLEVARELVAARVPGAGSSDLAVRLHRAAGGNPLAILELLADPERLEAGAPDAPIPVPTTLGRVFAQRADRLSPAARTALLLAAVTGGDLPVTARACAAAGVPADALAQAEQAQLVAVADGRIAFRHPLARSAVYGAATPADRRAAHVAAAAALPRHDAERRAWHLGEAAIAPDEPTAAALADVGRRAAGRSAHAVAATAYERAARLTPDDAARAGRFTDAGAAAGRAGQVERAMRLLDEGRALVPPAAAGRISWLAGRFATRSGAPSAARDSLLAAGRDVAAADPDLAVALLAEAVHACYYACDSRSALAAAAWLDELLAGPRTPRARALGTMAAGMALVLAGRRGGVDRIREAVDQLAAAPGVLDPASRPVWTWLGTLWLRESGAGRRLVADAVDELRALTAADTLPALLFHVARDDATTNRWAAAEVAYDEGVRLARETGQTTDLAACLAGLAWLEARQGKASSCRAHASEAMRLAESRGVVVAGVWARFALAELDLAEGRTDDARSGLRLLHAELDRTGLEDPDVSPAPELVEVLLRLGLSGEAGDVAASYRARAAGKGQPWALARAGRVAGMLCADDEVDARFAGALELHARTPDLFETARTRLAYGERLRRAKRRADARPHLRAALEAFELLGAVPWADTAARELRATGETARRRAGGDAAALTPQERQIAVMLAEGRTTRQAAAALFLSPKTVEYHLRHVYLKLGIASRAELAGALPTIDPGRADAAG